MEKRIRAKLQCVSVQEFYSPGTASKKTGESVTLNAVYSSDPDSPNHQWSIATPSAQLAMHISNPGAWGAFKGGQEWFVDLTPAD
jgi:hypothetical protein